MTEHDVERSPIEPHHAIETCLNRAIDDAKAVLWRSHEARAHHRRKRQGDEGGYGD